MVWRHVYLVRLWEWGLHHSLIGLWGWSCWHSLIGLWKWGTHSCPVPAPQTTLGDLGPQLGGTLHPQSISLAMVAVSHQMLGASRPLHGMVGFVSSGSEEGDWAMGYCVFSQDI